MTKQFFSLVILFMLIGCSSDSSTTTDQEGNDVEVEDTVFESSITINPDSALVIKNAPTIWTADFEEATNTYKIHKPVNARLDTLSGEKLVSLINVNRDSIHLIFNKISHDTIYVTIPDSKYLTQNIGNTGAENYLATATFSLTEMKGVKYVNYKFAAGDHASPGVYSRKDFKDLQ